MLGRYELAKIFLDNIKESIVESSLSKQLSRISDIAKLYFIIGKSLQINAKIETIMECYRVSAEYFSKDKNWENYCLVQLFHCQILKDNNSLSESVKVGNQILKACDNIKPNISAGSIYLSSILIILYV